MIPTNKQPLFIITGASCVGKSTMCEELFKDETDYIVMEGDLLWNEIYATPDDNYNEYRQLWMRVCSNISQIGKPVVLCGCSIPEQFERQPERKLFNNIYYLALVCEEQCLEKRIRNGRGVSDKKKIKSAIHFNKWLENNWDKTKPNMTLLDTTYKTPQKAAVIAHEWIMKNMKK